MADTAQARPATRRRGLLIIAALVLLAAVAWAVWHWLHGRHQESTDNAYVNGNLVQITAQLGGTAVAIGAQETDRVAAGQTLVQLDGADARLALDQAEAQLAQSVRDLRGVYANSATLTAQISRSQADAQRARADVARLREDVARRAPLRASGAVSAEELAHSEAQLVAAQSAQAAADAAVRAAHEQLKASQTQTAGATVATHPAVARAVARVREAALAVQRTAMIAPVDATVAKRQVQLGQRVVPGTPLLTLVALDQLWVDANFKEGQLAALRIGQPAELTADVYGSRVVYHGHIEGLGAGTGAAFALLPAQNATGNWIKIVQRVPVRIALDAADLRAHPLRVGLSMDVTVDTRDSSGPLVASAPRREPVAQTAVYRTQEQAANAEAERLIETALK